MSDGTVNQIEMWLESRKTTWGVPAMKTQIRVFAATALCALVLVAPTVVAADAPTGAAAMPPQMIALKVGVDAAGKVTSSTPWDPQAAAGLNKIAEEFARKLVFAPARKDGKPVSSQTSLTLVLALEPVGEGRFAPKLKRAFNGPGLVHMGKMKPPEYQGRKGGALVVVGVNVGADGVPDASTQTTERMELRDPNKFAEARYLDAVSISVRGSRFEVDKVDGVAIASRVSLPYQFGGGAAKPKPGDDEGKRGGKPPVMDIASIPIMTAVSAVPGVELAKVDYRAPAAATTAK